ncbi:MAG: aminotransferase class III-fold pyridoxal phosphate-dependent enzyme [Actinomycetota bacterium]
MTSERSHLSGIWRKATDLRIERGHGCRVVDPNGVEYLDFTAGIAAASTGHAHPRVVQAITEQAQRIVHAQINVYTHDLLEPLATRLAEITPASIDTFYFCSTSDEAVEGAVKLARHATGRRNVVALDGAFHGRTALTMAMSTSRSIDRQGYGPMPPGVFIAPFPDPHASDQEAEVTRALRGLDRLFVTQLDPTDCAALVVEPVIGERGFIPAPRAFLDGLAARCDDHGILLVVDETQSGFGRTGKMFAIESTDIEPDVMVMAKGIASGFPMAAVGTRRQLDERWITGSHSGSSNGNPIACAAALATIDVLTEPGVLDAVAERGDQLITALRELQQLDPALLHVRGRGLMVATEFDTADRAEAVVRHCLEEYQVILMTAGTRGRTIRWMPPLVVSSDEIKEAVAAFAAAIRATG